MHCFLAYNESSIFSASDLAINIWKYKANCIFYGSKKKLRKKRKTNEKNPYLLIDPGLNEGVHKMEKYFIINKNILDISKTFYNFTMVSCT